MYVYNSFVPSFSCIVLDVKYANLEVENKVLSIKTFVTFIHDKRDRADTEAKQFI